MSTTRAKINPSKASLVGGIAVGIASMVLWLAVTRELGFGGALTWGRGLWSRPRWRCGRGWPISSVA